MDSDSERSEKAIPVCGTCGNNIDADEEYIAGEPLAVLLLPPLPPWHHAWVNKSSACDVVLLPQPPASSAETTTTMWTA